MLFKIKIVFKGKTRMFFGFCVLYTAFSWVHCDTACLNDDDAGLNVLRCWVDISGTNCNKLLKLKINVGWGGAPSASVRITI